MKINKNPALLGIILFVAMLAYSLILFIAVNDKNANFWIGYSFTIVAFLLQIVTDVPLLYNKNSLKDIFFGIPMEELGSIYLIVQLILGFIIIFVPNFNTTLAIVLNIIVLAVFFVVLISSFIAKDVIVKVDEKVQQKTFYIKSLLSDVEIINSKTEDPVLRKSLKSLEDTIKYSDPMSHDSLNTIENKIELKVSQLGGIIENGKAEDSKALINEIELLFVERNKKCKVLK